MDSRRDDAATLQRESLRQGESSATMYALVVTAGPDVGARVLIDALRPGRLLVGQGPACDLRLSDRHASRRHAALEVTPLGLRVRDLESTNGTFAQGMRVTEAYLQGGEDLRIGETVLRVEQLHESPAGRLTDEMRFGKMVGASAGMRRLYPLCERLAVSELPVVIEGETGTGKEVLAEALHEASPRAKGPFVVFDCTAVPANLLESALFGHERGAFTGAEGARLGVFEQASGGTLFIDELGELALTLQPKLLRALERSEVQRLGSNQWTRIDARIIAATRRDLDHEVQAGRFRDDLFFRLAIGRIELPPLRDRAGDVPLLARHFWRVLGGQGRPLPDGLLERFEDYAWPGNVRELHNAVARQLALGEVTLEDLGMTGATAITATRAPDRMAAGDFLESVLESELALPRARAKVVLEFERRYVQRVLAQYGGNVVRAAAASGIARRYFQLLRARQPK